MVLYTCGSSFEHRELMDTWFAQSMSWWTCCMFPLVWFVFKPKCIPQSHLRTLTPRTGQMCLGWEWENKHRKRVLRKILSRQCSSLLVKDRLQFILRLDASSYLFPSSSSRYTKCTWLQELFSSNPPSASCSWVISRSEWCQIMFPTWSNVFRMHLWPHSAHFLGRVLLQMFLYLGTITVFSLPRRIIPWG